jgi:hypothetical protein
MKEFACLAIVAKGFQLRLLEQCERLVTRIRFQPQRGSLRTRCGFDSGREPNLVSY